MTPWVPWNPTNNDQTVTVGATGGFFYGSGATEVGESTIPSVETAGVPEAYQRWRDGSA